MIMIRMSADPPSSVLASWRLVWSKAEFKTNSPGTNNSRVSATLRGLAAFHYTRPCGQAHIIVLRFFGCLSLTLQPFFTVSGLRLVSSIWDRDWWGGGGIHIFFFFLLYRVWWLGLGQIQPIFIYDCMCSTWVDMIRYRCALTVLLLMLLFQMQTLGEGRGGFELMFPVLTWALFCCF